MHPTTIERDTVAPDVAGGPAPDRPRPRWWRDWDRSFLIGCVAGALIGTALAVPTGYALSRISPDITAEVSADGSTASDTRLLEGGLQALANKDPRRALMFFRAAEQLSPTSAIVHNDICVALNELRRYEDAVVACQRAAALDPNLALAMNNLAWARTQLSKARLSPGDPR
jgi:tetratricopeptide (TPR) repeat protein